jgi:hypothetical protein
MHTRGSAFAVRPELRPIPRSARHRPSRFLVRVLQGHYQPSLAKPVFRTRVCRQLRRDLLNAVPDRLDGTPIRRHVLETGNTV